MHSPSYPGQWSEFQKIDFLDHAEYNKIELGPRIAEKTDIPEEILKILKSLLNMF